MNDSSFNRVSGKKSGLLWWLALLILLAFAFAVFKNYQLFATDLVQSIFDNAISATTPATQQPAKEPEQPRSETSSVVDINAAEEPEAAIVREFPKEQVGAASAGAEVVTLEQKVATIIVSGVIEKAEVVVEQQEAETEGVEIEQEVVTASTQVDSTPDYRRWLEAKLQQSREWLIKADGDKVSIQVLVRSKSAAKELAYFLAA